MIAILKQTFGTSSPARLPASGMFDGAEPPKPGVAEMTRSEQLTVALDLTQTVRDMLEASAPCTSPPGSCIAQRLLRMCAPCQTRHTADQLIIAIGEQVRMSLWHEEIRDHKLADVVRR